MPNNCESSDKSKITLKEYIDLKFEVLKDASDKSEDKLNIRLNTMNEIREQLTSQAQTFINRSEFEGHNNLINNKIENLQKITYIGTGILIAVQIILRFLK